MLEDPPPPVSAFTDSPQSSLGHRLSTRFSLNETGRDFGALSRALGTGDELYKMGCPV